MQRHRTILTFPDFFLVADSILVLVHVDDLLASTVGIFWRSERNWPSVALHHKLQFAWHVFEQNGAEQSLRLGICQFSKLINPPTEIMNFITAI